MTAAWTAPTTPEVAARRAGGRRRYNAWRQQIAQHRRTILTHLLFAKGNLFEKGIQARLARKLGVSRSTICRDVKALLREGHPCPCCGAYTHPPKPDPTRFVVEEPYDTLDDPNQDLSDYREPTWEDVVRVFREPSTRNTSYAEFRHLTRVTSKAFTEQVAQMA
jgi:hypothetical protein